MAPQEQMVEPQALQVFLGLPVQVVLRVLQVKIELQVFQV
jgi:hypothetical protein